jgi:hypothetical protein
MNSKTKTDTFMDTNVSHVESYKVGKLEQVQYTKSNPHPKWKEGWFSHAKKYKPMTDFSDFDCIEEITVWDKVEFKIPSHTYVLNRAGYCNGYFINNIIDRNHWFEFGQSNKGFSKSHRKFKKVKIGKI